MTPERYKECLSLLGLSQRGLTPLLSSAQRLTREWATGASSIPREIAVWLESCVALRASKPKSRLPKPPTSWRRDPAIIWITHNGHRYSLNQACALAGIARASVYYRVNRYGLSWQAAFNFVKKATLARRNEVDKVGHRS